MQSITEQVCHNCSVATWLGKIISVFVVTFPLSHAICMPLKNNRPQIGFDKTTCSKKQLNYLCAMTCRDSKM